MSVAQSSNRVQQIQQKMRGLLQELSGLDLNDLDQSASFLELGFDSLFLIQFSQAIKKGFKVKITFRQLIEQYASPEALIGFLDEKAPDNVLPATEETAAAPAPAATNGAAPPADLPSPGASIGAPAPVQMSLPPMPAVPNSDGSDPLRDLMAQQLQLMSYQLSMLTGQPPAEMPAVAPAQPAAQADSSVEQPEQNDFAVVERTSDEPTYEDTKRKRFGPYKPIKKGEQGKLTERQQKHLDAFMERLIAKTKGSKENAQEHRAHLADPRGIYGYRQVWKEMVYQIAVTKSKGSKLWDVDGNEYIDIAMGFGLNLFGHSPDFVIDAVREQLERGVEVGPQCPNAGIAAKLMTEFTGQERVTFCNTGSEAVMAALRLARLHTGNNRYIFFSGAYHGNFDQVLVRANVVGNMRRTVAAAPGVSEEIAQNAIVLEYGDPNAIDIIMDNLDELAAILVEPVQSSKPDLQPLEFMQKLRELTAEHDIPLIMDEVISGFRASPGGAQEWFGIDADMATYGKILGGGLPIGALAGKAKYMDGIDSGMWNYGDDSYPEADITFFAGTFVRHPLAMAAARAVLEHLKAAGPELQEELTNRTKYLVDTMNAFFEERQVPIRLLQYTSLFRFSYAMDMEYIDMVYYTLLEKGIFTRGFLDNCFLSTAHSDEDVERIIQAMKETVLELQEGGFLPEPGGPNEELEPVAMGETLGASAPNGDGLPLTEAQMEIWLASQLGDQAAMAFNEGATITLKGEIDLPAFKQALQTVMLRHEALHLRINAEDASQWFSKPEPFEIFMDDATGKSEDEQEAQWIQLQHEEAGTLFDLTNGPLVRLRMLKLSDTEYRICMVANHLGCDGWSWAVIMEELAQLYTGLRTGEPVELDEADSYRAYIQDELEAAESEDLKESYQYWVEQFAEMPPVLDLPVDQARPAFKPFDGHTAHYEIAPELADQAREFAKENGVSLFTLLLGVYESVISHLSGQNDLVVAIPTAGQLQAGAVSLVGHCVNLLPLRTQLNDEQPVGDFLKDLMSSILDAYDHQECTYGGILKHLSVPRDPSRLPLAQVMFNVDVMSPMHFEGLDVVISQPAKRAINFDMFFNITDNGSQFVIDCDYNSYLYTHNTVQRWNALFETTLKRLLESSEQPLGQLAALHEEDVEVLYADWQDTEKEYPSDSPFHILFEKQAKKTPDAPAVRFDDTTLTYRELDEYANQFGHYMESLGVGPETLVGVHMERSAGMLAVLLGIWKAGGAYVPMDPNYPASRIGFMIEDAGISVLLTEELFLKKLKKSANLSKETQVVCLDEEWNKISNRSKKKVKSDSQAQHLAYVIYTSGSTGKPKGVEIQHRALVNFLWSMKERPGMSKNDILASVTTLSFDIAGLEFYLPLLAGGQVVILSHEVASDGVELARALEKYEATIMQATPATWRMLIESGWDGQKDLRMLCGGEALPISLAKALLERGSELWNMYGPTETTIWSSVEQIKEEDELITIGKPIANTQFYLLNDSGQLVPPGSIGKLYIGGDGLARGYLNREELTAERFVRPQFDGAQSSRIYNTGDLGRRLPDGRFECLGRTDNQVKVRGFRIELGEIESKLEEHESVIEAAVIARPDDNGEMQLLGYYAAREKVSVNFLREHLRDVLPEYMVPAVFVHLDALPHTPNGKIDRNALPKPNVERPDLEDAFIAPRTPTETTITEIWSELLGVPKIGIHDNFFDLGGHSLQATRVLARIREHFQQDVSLRAFFEGPTVAELAVVITYLQASEEADEDILELIEELEGLSDDEVQSLMNDSE